MFSGFRRGTSLPSGVRKESETGGVTNVWVPSAVSLLRTQLGAGLASNPRPPGRQGACTLKMITGLASLPPTVQISLPPPKSSFPKRPVVDHRPVSSVDAMTGLQSVVPFIIVLPLIG